MGRSQICLRTQPSPLPPPPPPPPPQVDSSMLDPRSNFHKNRVRFSDHIIGRITEDNSYNSYGGGGVNMNNYGVRARQTGDGHPKYRGWMPFGGDGDDRKLVEHDDEDSDVCSPPLWTTSPPTSLPHRPNHYRSLSPTSRTQAIARGQRELMEMVSRMPEGSYELSLKDLVEHPVVLEDDKRESFGEDRSVDSTEPMHRRQLDKEVIIKKNGSSKKVQLQRQMNRNGSIDNGGLLLKMVFPVPWTSRKKNKSKKSGSNNNSAVMTTNSGSKDGRVSPRPLLCDGSPKRLEEDQWWKKQFSESAGSSESAGFSSNSGRSKSSGSSSSRSSSRNSTRNGRDGCWSCFFIRRGKRAAE